MARFGKSELTLSNTISALVTELNNVADDLGNIDNLTDSNVVLAIQHLDSDNNFNVSSIGSLPSLTTTAKNNLVAAINDINARVMEDVIDDTSPQLGGALDLNSNNVTGTGNISITGSLTTTAAINSGSANITTTGNITGPVTEAVITTLRLKASGWTITQDGSNNLIFDYNGSDKMKLDASGNLTVVGNVTAFGTI